MEQVKYGLSLTCQLFKQPKHRTRNRWIIIKGRNEMKLLLQFNPGTERRYSIYAGSFIMQRKNGETINWTNRLAEIPKSYTRYMGRYHAAVTVDAAIAEYHNSGDHSTNTNHLLVGNDLLIAKRKKEEAESKREAMTNAASIQNISRSRMRDEESAMENFIFEKIKDEYSNWIGQYLHARQNWRKSGRYFSYIGEIYSVESYYNSRLKSCREIKDDYSLRIALTAMGKFNNSELRREYIESRGGYIEWLRRVGAEIINIGHDGKHPIELYRINGHKWLVVTDHSTERQYAIMPPNQKTKSAKTAWKSTFPVQISYRQGDVGIAAVDESGNVINQSIISQS